MLTGQILVCLFRAICSVLWMDSGHVQDKGIKLANQPKDDHCANFMSIMDLSS